MFAKQATDCRSSRRTRALQYPTAFMLGSVSQVMCVCVFFTEYIPNYSFSNCGLDFSGCIQFRFFSSKTEMDSHAGAFLKHMLHHFLKWRKCAMCIMNSDEPYGGGTSWWHAVFTYSLFFWQCWSHPTP